MVRRRGQQFGYVQLENVNVCAVMFTHLCACQSAALPA